MAFFWQVIDDLKQSAPNVPPVPVKTVMWLDTDGEGHSYTLSLEAAEGLANGLLGKPGGLAQPSPADLARYGRG
jgi:hypothetical protein